eukprot:10504791-Prorocentrum_lima.AAC.1
MHLAPQGAASGHKPSDAFAFPACELWQITQASLHCDPGVAAVAASLADRTEAASGGVGIAGTEA